MKIIAFALTMFFPVLAFTSPGRAADLSGPQPPAPYGIFSTLSADSPEKGRSAVAFTFEQSGDPDYYRISSQLAVGITRSLELGMNIPYLENSDRGLEDIAFTLKHRFFEEGMYGPSVAYLITGQLASNTEELSSDGGVGAGIVASKRVGPVRGHVNFIYTKPWDSSLEDEMRMSAGVDFAASHDFRILAELLLKKTFFSDKIDQREARVGYRFLYHNDVFSTIGVGFGIGDEKSPEYRIIASVSLIFPRKAQSIERSYEEEE